MVWESGTEAPASFAAAWSERLRHSHCANFSMDLAFIAWEDAHGRPSRAVLHDEGRGLAAIFRRTPSGWSCGWPWRPQVVLDSGDEDAHEWPAPPEMRRALQACVRAARLDHARIFLPADAVDERTAYHAGTTVSVRLDLDETKLFWGMDHNKRHNLKQALGAGFEIAEATTQEDFRAFAKLKVLTELRYGVHAPPIPEAPASGEAWREWELPWTWLLLARRGGRIEAGLGFGRFAAGVLDARENASLPEAKQAGANVLLAWEAIRRGSLAGYRRMNWGGNTIFKRGFGGAVIPMMCHPEGGPLWRVPDGFEVQWHRARHTLARECRNWMSHKRPSRRR
jgi:hypothetical protein